MKRALWSAVSGVALLGIACSSSSSSSVSADQACADYASAFCKRINDCAPFYVQLSYGDTATCTARLKLACAPALSANGTSTTAQQAEDCSAQIGGTSCDDALSRNLPEICRSKPGTLANGAACGDGAQCTGTVCNKPSGQTCGACSTRVAAGSACTSDDVCDYGESCKNGACVKFGNAGDTCDGQHPCKASLACKGGTCTTPLGAGAPCTGNFLANDCDILKGLVCVNSVCTQVQLAGAGQACGFDNTSATLCSDSGHCKVAGASTKGTCVAVAADGAACDTVNGPDCLPPSTCVSGVCKLSDASSCK